MADRHNDPTWTPHCICCGPIALEEYTRHHLIPKAHPVYKSYAKLRKAGPETVPLCKACHKLVHRVFGEGHKFHGPMTRLSLAQWLKTQKAKYEEVLVQG